MAVDAVVCTGRAYHEALLVEGGRVIAVGSRAQVLREAPTGAERLRLDGRLVIPGLVDAHLHLSALIQGRSAVDLAGARSAEEVAARAAAWASAHPEGPVVGRGWDESGFDSAVAPTAHEIDRAVRDRAVVLYRVCGHAAVVNSTTLDRLGAVPNPPRVAGGRFGVAADGRPNGLLYERALDQLRPVVAEVPPVRPEEVLAFAHEAASLGITRVGSLSATAEESSVVERAAAAQTLPCGVQLYLRADEWRAHGGGSGSPPSGEDRPLVAGVKAFADGSFGARTAWLDEPYADAEDERGMPTGAEAELAELVRATSDKGTSLAIHAIGDRALGAALAAFAEVPDAPGPRIEHASLTPPLLWAEMHAFPGTFVVQPTFAWTDGWIPERLGRSRARWTYAWRTLKSLGLRLAGSSDAPFDDLDPWRGMASAVLGPSWRSGDPARCSERLSPEEALTLYTEGGARALGGSPSDAWPGAPDGSFVVLDAPDLAAALRAGRGAVLATWRRGRRAWARAPPDGAGPGSR